MLKPSYELHGLNIDLATCMHLQLGIYTKIADHLIKMMYPIERNPDFLNANNKSPDQSALPQSDQCLGCYLSVGTVGKFDSCKISIF